MVILTSNGTRELSDALRRRCLYHYLDYPDRKKELAIVQRRLPEINQQLATQIVDFIQHLREQEMVKKPGVAETLDWATAMMGLGIEDLQQHVDAVLNSRSCFIKTREDLEEINRASGGEPVEAGKLTRPNPSGNILGFLGHLRSEGFLIGVAESSDALKAIADHNQPDKAYDYAALRALSCGNQDQWQRFDQLYRKFWFPDQVAIKELDAIAQLDPRARNRSGLSGIGGSSEQNEQLIYDNADLQGIGAGTQRSITKTDFRFLNDKKAMRKAEMLAELLARRLHPRLRRRWEYRSQGSKLELKRTIKKSVLTGGMPIKRTFKQRRQTPPHIVVLHDISHSMAWNNPLLFRFAEV